MPTTLTTRAISDLSIIMKKPRLTRWELLLRGLDRKRSLDSLTWTSIAPLSGPRWRAAAFNIMQRLWVVGGYHADGTLADIEVFDPATRQFTTYPLPTRGALVRHLDIDESNGDLWAAYGASPGVPSKVARLRLRG